MDLKPYIIEQDHGTIDGGDDYITEEKSMITRDIKSL